MLSYSDAFLKKSSEGASLAFFFQHVRMHVGKMWTLFFPEIQGSASFPPVFSRLTSGSDSTTIEAAGQIL
jgi:hypothetical protein